MRFAMVMFLLLSSAPAFADADELYVDATLVTEGAWLSNPAVASTPFESSSFALLPRVGVSMRWGLTNSLTFGVGIDASYWPSVHSSNAMVEVVGGNRTRTGALYSQHLVASLPFSASYRLDFGWPVAAVVEVQGGPLFGAWIPGWLASETAKDSTGEPLLILDAAQIAPQYWPGGVARLQVALETRLFDVLVLSVAPSIGASWAGSLALHAGLSLRVSFVTGVGSM